MDLRQLAYVLAVVDHGGFTKAAAAVHVAQPSLSQAVRALEADLGAELFHRTSRGVTLTAAGEALVDPARQALRDAATVRAAVAQVAGLEAGHLDLVCLPTLAAHPVSGLIGRFRRAHPQVTVRLVEPEDADAVAERVHNGSSEVGFAELPLSNRDLAANRLEAQDFVALMPVELAAAMGAGPRISIRALAQQPLIATPIGTSTRRQIDDALADAGLEANVAVETDQREAIGPLVVAGAGVAVLPRPVAEQAATRDAVIREITPRLSRQVGVIHRKGSLSPAAQSFLALALERDPRPKRPSPRRRR